VLLADDNQPFLNGVSALLVSSFDIVGTARDGQELVSEATRLAPDVIVVDITMPVCSGIEAARALREAGSKARFVFLTIHDESAFVDACFEEGALGYVIKPRVKTDLIVAIEAALHGSSFVSPNVAR
jgi:DNA-binding NarL/FixJ family response regulator